VLKGLSTERARAIGQAAYKRVLAEHTYAHRAELMERIIEGAAEPKEVAA
jgi:spore maturation protein CgeB